VRSPVNTLCKLKPDLMKAELPKANELIKRINDDNREGIAATRRAVHATLRDAGADGSLPDTVRGEGAQDQGGAGVRHARARMEKREVDVHGRTLAAATFADFGRGRVGEVLKRSNWAVLTAEIPHNKTNSSNETRSAKEGAALQSEIDMSKMPETARVLERLIKWHESGKELDLWLPFPQKLCSFYFGPQKQPVPVGALFVLWKAGEPYVQACPICNQTAHMISFGGGLSIGGGQLVCRSCANSWHHHMGGLGRVMEVLKAGPLARSEFRCSGALFGAACPSDGRQLCELLGVPEPRDDDREVSLQIDGGARFSVSLAPEVTTTKQKRKSRVPRGGGRVYALYRTCTNQEAGDVLFEADGLLWFDSLPAAQDEYQRSGEQARECIASEFETIRTSESLVFTSGYSWSTILFAFPRAHGEALEIARSRVEQELRGDSDSELGHHLRSMVIASNGGGLAPVGDERAAAKELPFDLEGELEEFADYMS
jgi:hypothetical protein